ncbi:MAG: YfhO family protein, partial [Pedosphaera parvula]|nr:YfhO family protein [Pedosphaera parvula]
MIIFAVFSDVLLGTGSFVFRDFGLFGYPLAHHFRESFWRGEIPLWNPLNNCGLPFLAQWNTMVCYPGSIIYLALPLPWSLNLFCLLHLLLAGVTMYFLALRWTESRFAASVAGLAFAFSGTVLGTLIWPNYIAVLAWMPAVILCCERAWLEGGRRLLIAGLIGAMQMLAGAPELIFFTWLIVLVLWVDQWWQRTSSRATLTRRFLAVVALVTGLSAVQLFPFLDLLLHSHRNTQSDTDAWSMPFSGLANCLVPLFRTHQLPAGVHFQQDQRCLSSIYGGIGVMALALWALVRTRQRRVWLLGAMLLVSTWLSLGDKGHLYNWLRQAIPSANF